ncbi:MAG: YkgJ family cysteine cluster protein [Candidatus Micrarchaeia archaeon]
MKNSKFKCINCGYCCKNMQNLALFEWEKDLLLSLDPSIKIIPGNKIKYKNTEIILYWGLQTKPQPLSKSKAKSIQKASKNDKISKISSEESCPFLSFEYGVSKCNIYENRPLVCRAFPLFHLGFKFMEGMISIDCPEHIIPFNQDKKINKGEFYSLLYSVYDNTFLNAFRLELARVWISDVAELVLNYLKENEIKISEREIGLLELAVKIGVLTEDEIEKEINFIYSEEIQDMFNQNLNFKSSI